MKCNKHGNNSLIRDVIYSLVALLLCASISSCSDKTPEQPNILLIVADDLGNNDLGSFGDGSAPTPNIDQLANDGIRFTRHYAHATCRPSRMALLTGLNASQVAVPPHVRGIAPEITTLPEALKEAGYNTHHIGKWHLGHHHPLAEPDAQGFDSWFGFLTALSLKRGTLERPGSSYYNPWLQADGMPAKQHKGHLTDILTEAAIKKITQSSVSDKPWFINLWFFAPHGPIQPAERFSSKYPDTKEGAYLALLAQLDSSVASILTALEDTGKNNNTIVIFVSDNGGTERYRDSNYPFYGHKATFFEGGLRTPLAIYIPDNIHNGLTIKDAVYINDLMPTILNLASADIPDNLTGTSLHPYLFQQANNTVKRDRFWDFQTVNYGKFGHLSADNSTLSQNGTEQHYNNEADKFGEPENIALGNNTLEESYNRWKWAARVANISVTPIQENAKRINGDAFRRTPGFGGWSFQVPLEIAKYSQLNDQIIAYQEGQFSIRYSQQHNTFNIELPGKSLTINAPPLNACSHLLTLSTYYRWDERKPHKSSAHIRLFLDDQVLHTEEFPIKTSSLNDSLSDTLLGTKNNNSESFSGRVGRPLIHNDYIYKSPVERYQYIAGNNPSLTNCGG